MSDAAVRFGLERRRGPNHTEDHWTARAGDQHPLAALHGSSVAPNELSENEHSLPPSPLSSTAGCGRVRACQFVKEHCADAAHTHLMFALRGVTPSRSHRQRRNLDVS